jgi:hypothetical protein
MAGVFGEQDRLAVEPGEGEAIGGDAAAHCGGEGHIWRRRGGDAERENLAAVEHPVLIAWARTGRNGPNGFVIAGI